MQSFTQSFSTGKSNAHRVLGTALFGSSLILGFGILGAGCPDGEPVVDAGDPDAPPICDLDPCKRNIDCEAGAICEKEAEAGVDDWGCCLKVLCTVDADCSDTEICDQRRGLCVPEDLCDPGNPAAKCQPGEFCIYQDGLPQCVDQSMLPQPDSCAVNPSSIYLADGESQALNTTGALNSGALVPNATFTYATTGDIGTIAGGDAFEAACAGPAACTGTVTATAGAANCSANVTVYPPVADFRVTLFDSRSNTPIQGATIALQIDGEADLVTATTTAAGDAVFTSAQLTGTVLAASAFPADFHWQTVLNPGTNDVVFYTVAVPDETKTAGIKGEVNFDNVSTQGDIKLALAGLSIRSSLVDTDFALLLGEIADYEIELEGVTNGPEVVPLPGGLVIELGTTEIKSDFVAQGDPGQRILWALGGKVRLADIGPIISSVTASEEVNFGSILGAVLPFFARFDHAVVTGDKLNLTPVDKPTPPGPDLPIPFEDWPFEALTGADAMNLNTLLSQNATYDVPTLPCVAGAVDGTGCTDNAYASGAILLTGVVVPGQGIVPLGLTAGLDDPDDQAEPDQVDGLLDYLDDSVASGQALLDYAPPHDGLEGNPYITLAVALDIEGLAGGGGLAASTIVHVADSFSAGTNNFPVDFVQQPGGTFDRAAGTMLMAPVGASDFYRLNISEGTAEWNVYMEDAPATAIDLRALQPAGVTGRIDQIDIGAFVLGNGYLTGEALPSFTDLIDFNGTNFDENFVYYMGAWASTECLKIEGDVTAAHCETTD